MAISFVRSLSAEVPNCRSIVSAIAAAAVTSGCKSETRLPFHTDEIEDGSADPRIIPPQNSNCGMDPQSRVTVPPNDVKDAIRPRGENLSFCDPQKR